MPSFQSFILPMSTATPETVMPIVPECLSSSTSVLAAIMALLGMQPQFRHTPPMTSRSMHSVRWPSCARRIAAT